MQKTYKPGVGRKPLKPDYDRLVNDYVGDKIPLWEKIMDRQGTVCCAWEKTVFEEGLKVGIRLMMEVCASTRIACFRIVIHKVLC